MKSKEKLIESFLKFACALEDMSPIISSDEWIALTKIVGILEDLEEKE